MYEEVNFLLIKVYKQKLEAKDCRYYLEFKY